MKKIGMLATALLYLIVVNAQQNQGKIIYERTMQMQVSFAGMNEEMQRMIPRSRTDKFELDFANNQSLWKQAEQEQDDEMMGGEGGMQIRIRASGNDDVVYSNFDKAKRVELRDIMERKFLIEDSIRPLKWKMTGETRNILNHNCMKATATSILPRTMTRMDNGNLVREQVIDTSVVTAWFATDIPVSAGPGEYQGQLPGVILELEIPNRVLYKAIQITEKADVAAIKEPQGKKRYTQAEFVKERDKMLEDMQKSGGGGQRIIRF